MTLFPELKTAEVAYSYKCELCGIREWHVKPTTKFHYNNVNKCSGIWVEEKWFNASFLEIARKELKAFVDDEMNWLDFENNAGQVGVERNSLIDFIDAVFGGERK